MLLKPARVNDLQNENSIEPELARNCKQATTTHQNEKQCLKETTTKFHNKRQGAPKSTPDQPETHKGEKDEIEPGANRTTSEDQ
ncbi:hypothetical protein Bca52824_003941 [Brassica carinata]|uniref:Uncharacterized protein n=1 Tax=Brassica carinata TaxID=52824 RepID=A0A8X7WM23_BRACI|nr:hypothetical protein Bca52824_003941 [Brassica carinata]